MLTDTQRRDAKAALATTATFRAYLGRKFPKLGNGTQLQVSREMLLFELQSEAPRRSVLKRLHSLHTELRREAEWREYEKVLS